MKTRTIETVESQLNNAIMAKSKYECEYGYADGERQDRLGDAIIAKRKQIFDLEAELCDLKGLE
jgi:hypothetical protein